MSLAERDPNKDILAEKSAGKYMVSAGRRRDGSGFLSYCYGCCVTDVAKYDDFDPDFHKFTDGLARYQKCISSIPARTLKTTDILRDPLLGGRNRNRIPSHRSDARAVLTISLLQYTNLARQNFLAVQEFRHYASDYLSLRRPRLRAQCRKFHSKHSRRLPLALTFPPTGPRLNQNRPDHRRARLHRSGLRSSLRAPSVVVPSIHIHASVIASCTCHLSPVTTFPGIRGLGGRWVRSRAARRRRRRTGYMTDDDEFEESVLSLPPAPRPPLFRPISPFAAAELRNQSPRRILMFHYQLSAKYDGNSKRLAESGRAG
ncbi:hypothetical protein GWI33_007695 [Rhynchophorus ferrugineus]|uniref:Uncharacterized protein n=1 Tax=Rhynchophorus ferrugineus TaxID=354439 RepID=A0A834MEP5_RHYFE|nr:hypothetical protein GWI33_007695 [Rhynchophorus ferrugineus]